MNPILNGEPDLHPLEHVGHLIADHTTLLRRRLHAAHLQDGLAPPAKRKTADPLELIKQTRDPNHSHMASLLSRFQGGS